MRETKRKKAKEWKRERKTRSKREEHDRR